MVQATEEVQGVYEGSKIEGAHGRGGNRCSVRCAKKSGSVG